MFWVETWFKLNLKKKIFKIDSTLRINISNFYLNTNYPNLKASLLKMFFLIGILIAKALTISIIIAHIQFVNNKSVCVV